MKASERGIDGLSQASLFEHDWSVNEPEEQLIVHHPQTSSAM